MALPPPFNDLSGEWKGSKRVFLQGEQGPVHASRIRMTIATAARNSFLMLAYTWKFETDPHEGVMLLGYDNEKQVATAALGDSWHMSKRLLTCAGRIGRDARSNRARISASSTVMWLSFHDESQPPASACEQ